MNKKQYIVAFEIGSSKVVGAVAEKTDDGRLVVQCLEDESQTNCVNYGQVQNVENIKQCIARITHVLESKLDGHITQFYVGLAGRTLHSEAGEVNRSIDATTAIQKTTIDNIMRDASRNNVKRYDTIDVVPRAFYVDKKLDTTNNPVGQYGSSIKIKFNLIVANSNIMLNLKRVMANRDVKAYLISTLAMGNNIISKDEKRLGCMLVDMGAETTSVAIYKGGMLVYLNTLPLGGRNLTLDVANGLNVLEETAERVKKNINNPLDLHNVDDIMVEGISSREAANYINARTGEIIANINKQLEYAGVNASDISTIILTGGAAQLKGMAHKLEDATKISVREATMPNNVHFPAGTRANRPEYVQVISLIAEAARIMDPMDTCVELNSYSDGHDIVINEPTTEEKHVQQPETESKKPHKKGSLMDRLTNLLNRMASEPEDEF